MIIISYYYHNQVICIGQPLTQPFKFCSTGIVNAKLSNGEYMVKGHEVTCFTNEEEGLVKLVEAMPFLLETKFVENGAVFKHAGQAWKGHVCVSKKEGHTGYVATGQNPNSATPLAEAIVKLLREK